MRSRRHGGWAAVALIAVLAGCSSAAEPAPTAASVSSTPPTVGMTPPVAPVAAGQKKWVDLDVGDCLADPPPTDPGVASVATVDCSQAHAAEVYLRAPVRVDAAIAGVADRVCTAGLSDYTGRSPGSFSMIYLIDSNQDRTSDNPLPSTVICLLSAADGRPLTSTARGGPTAAAR